MNISAVCNRLVDRWFIELFQSRIEMLTIPCSLITTLLYFYQYSTYWYEYSPFLHWINACAWVGKIFSCSGRSIVWLKWMLFGNIMKVCIVAFNNNHYRSRQFKPSFDESHSFASEQSSMRHFLPNIEKEDPTRIEKFPNVRCEWNCRHVPS